MLRPHHSRPTHVYDWRDYDPFDHLPNSAWLRWQLALTRVSRLTGVERRELMRQFYDICAMQDLMRGMAGGK